MLIDLTHKIETGMPVYPGDPLFQSRIVADHSLDGFRCSCWTMGSHLGTHIDFPFHQFVDGETVGDLSLDFFVGRAAVIDLSVETGNFYSQNPLTPFLIEPKLLEPFEKILENVSRILIKTDWRLNWKSPNFYRLFPSLLPETAEWIADFPIKLLGLETPSLAALSINHFMKDGTDSFSDSIDATDSQREMINEVQLHADQECHRILLGRRPPIILLEGLTCLEQLPVFENPSKDEFKKNHCSRIVPFDESKTFILYSFPLNIENADGCPVRVIAEISS